MPIAQRPVEPVLVAQSRSVITGGAAHLPDSLPATSIITLTALIRQVSLEQGAWGLQALAAFGAEPSPGLGQSTQCVWGRDPWFYIFQSPFEKYPLSDILVSDSSEKLASLELWMSCWSGAST